MNDGFADNTRKDTTMSRKANAAVELYDCAAVVLRMIDAIKGMQKLGKPETKGEAK